MATSATEFAIDRLHDYPETAMTPQPPSLEATVADDALAARRASARRTALIAAGIAVAVYVGFIVINAVAQ